MLSLSPASKWLIVQPYACRPSISQKGAHTAPPIFKRSIHASASVKANEEVQQPTTKLTSLVHNSLSETAFKQVERSGRFPKLNRNIDAEVVVVGAGVAGLTTALLLAQAGKQVVVLEAKIIGSGNSARHPGDLTTWKRNLYSSLLSLYDRKLVSSIARSHKAALDYIGKVVKAEGIDADYHQLDGYVFTYQGTDALRKAQKELSAAQDAGLTDVKLVDNVELGHDSGKLAHALVFPETAVLDPVKYVEGLADAVVKAGGQIFEQSRVRRANSRDCYLTNGSKVTARQAVVVATGTPITHDLIDSSIRAVAVHGKQFAKRRYAAAFSLPEGSAKEGVYYDLNEPPYAVRISKASGGKGFQLIVSGEEHDQGIPAGEYHDFYGRLETWVKGKWPSIQSRTNQWSYQVFETTEKLSFHGKDPAPSPNTDFYISHGDGGETIVSATLGGLIISDAILKKKNPFSELYSPERSLRGPGAVPPINPTYLKNTVQAVAGQIIPDFSTPKLSEIPNDSGALLQGTITKIAVYKDEKGEAHGYRAVCPHLGCLLQWNPLEKQWNCPCHGSCFDKRGSNLGGGPSTLDMEETSI